MVGMVKNTEHPKLTFSSSKKARDIPVTFKGESPHPLPQPRRGQALQQGGVKGSELELHIPIKAIENFKNLWKINISGRRFFCHGGMLSCWWTWRVLEPRGHSDCGVWCLLHNVVGEPQTESGKFLSVSFRAFWSQGLESKKSFFLVWTQKAVWRKIF